MGIFTRFAPTLDGAPVAIDGGTSRIRHIRIPSGDYETPLWLRTEAGLVVPVSSLPYQGVIPAGSLEVLSADPNAGEEVEPDFVEDFSDWTSTSDFINRGKSSGMYSNEDNSAQYISLDQTVGVAPLTQSMCVTYPGYDYGQVGAVCNGLTVGRNLTLPSPQIELWAEFYVKFQNWTLYPGYPGSVSSPCSGGYNPDFKLIFGRMNGPGDPSRFEVLWGNSVNGNIVTGFPGNEAAYAVNHPELVAASFDGNWHRVGVHWKYSTSAGIVELWVNGTQIWSRTSIATMASNQGQLWSLALGRNRDPQPSSIQKFWFGKVKVWYEGNNPGW